MSPLRAWLSGIRRVLSAPSLVAGVWALTTLVSLPLTLTIRHDIESHLGQSLAAGATAQGMNYEWMQEFARQSTGVATTLRPDVVGFSAVLDNLSAYVDNLQRPPAVAAAAGVYVLLWLFLAGGVIARYSADSGGRPARLHGFFSACGAYFFRFLRLGIVTAIVYGLLFGVLQPWLFTRLYPRLVHGVDVERTAFLIRGGLYAVFVLLLAAANIVFDYAKIRAVVEDRRSMLVAIAASCRFILRHPAGAIGVYLLDAALFAATLAAYALLAPPGGGTGVMAWAAVVIGQAYIAGRLCVKLLFWASETAFVEATLKGSRYEGRT
jgi:hypothetical protein